MSDILNIGISGLLAAKRSLDVVGHNIANVDTPGYSRQRVDLVARPGTLVSGGYVGNGVDIASSHRVVDDFVSTRLLGDTASLGRASSFSTVAARMDRLLSDADNGLAQPINTFFASLEGVAANPGSTAARQTAIEGLNRLVASFNDLQGQIDGLGAEIEAQIAQNVGEINDAARSIAQLNERIVSAQAFSGGSPPSDLLDQRDELLNQLSAKIGIRTTKLEDGSISVFIGSGQPLVLGNKAGSLGVAQDEFASGRQDITFSSGTVAVRITGQLGGGALGGLLDARREIVEPAQARLGQLALSVADAVNSQQAQGVDQNGNLGGDLFKPFSSTARGATANTGSAAVNFTVDDPAQLGTGDYRIEYDGSAWTLRNAGNGQTLPLSGTGTAADPFVGGGMRVSVSGAAQAGDRFLLQPTRYAAGAAGVTTRDPAAIAAASAVSAAAATGNLGTGTISAGSVVDAGDPALRSAVSISFTSASTYSLNGTGSYPYTPGSDIDHNGWRVQISGSPAAGDTFNVGGTPAGSSDNRNAKLLAAVGQLKVVGGRDTLSSANSSWVAQTGSTAQRAQLSVNAQTSLQARTLAERDSASGVNLDEEAANLLRFQQAYQAAAQAIAVADTIFQTLLGATRR
ncbi:MAG: flagellar hook-associated protein FlgK [Panacagrimonas sp.]